MYMKKLLIPVLALFWSLLLSLPALAQPSAVSASLSVETMADYYLSGESFQLRLSLSSAEVSCEAGGVELDILYDADVLELATPSDSDGWQRQIISPGQVKLLWFVDGQTLPLGASQSAAAVLSFTVKAGAAQQQSTAISLADSSLLTLNDGNASVVPIVADELSVPLSLQNLTFLNDGSSSSARVSASGLLMEQDYILYLAAYAQTGRMRGVSIRVITAQELERSAWSGDIAWPVVGAYRYKAMLLHKDSLCPALPAAQLLSK